MQHTDNHMDDMFRRAASDYPLKRAESNWEIIAKQLSGKKNVPAVPAKRNLRNRYLLFLLLVSLSAGGYVVYQWGVRNGEHISIQNKDPLILDLDKKQQKETDNGNQKIFYSIGEVSQALIFQDAELNKQTILPRIFPPIIQDRRSLPIKGNEDLATGWQQYPGSYADQKSRSSIQESKVKKNKEEIIRSGSVGFSLNIRKNNEILSGLLKEMHKPEHTKSRLRHNKALYFGLSAGPDFSNVKFQAITNVGFNYGFIAGYRFTDKFSLESGLALENKKYNSKGQYFKMNKIGSMMPAGMEIKNVSGNISLLEIPINLKYDFVRTERRIFFAKAGVSSYILLKEKNRYQISWNGNSQEMLSTYRQNLYHVPSAINFSLGFEKNIYKSYKIRIEPYIKIPVQGIGVGSMPVTSAGIQIGITRLVR